MNLGKTFNEHSTAQLIDGSEALENNEAKIVDELIKKHNENK